MNIAAKHYLKLCCESQKNGKNLNQVSNSYHFRIFLLFKENTCRDIFRTRLIQWAGGRQHQQQPSQCSINQATLLVDGSSELFELGNVLVLVDFSSFGGRQQSSCGFNQRQRIITFISGQQAFQFAMEDSNKKDVHSGQPVPITKLGQTQV